MSTVPPSKDMAEQDSHQHTTDFKEGATQSTDTDHVSASDEDKQERDSLNVKQSEEDSASSSAATNRENEEDNGEDKEPADVKSGDSAKEKVVPLTFGSSFPDDIGALSVVDDSTQPHADDGGHGDCNRPTPRSEQPATIDATSKEDHTGEKQEPKTTSLPTPDDRKNDRVDGPNTRQKAETTGTNNIDTEAGEDNASSQDTASLQRALEQDTPNEEVRDEQRDDIETIHPTTEENTEPESPGGSSRYLIAVGIVVGVAILMQHLLQPESPPQKNDVRQIDIFLRQMDKLKTQFPNQRAELWNRSKIHLLRHLQTAQPTEPVSLILTAGLRAEKTLRCLAQGLASAFSSTLNASVLQIDGASKARQNSDQVKLDIDSKLQAAFEGDKPVAVIHRFEELPPGSTLIFYRYCDHENAAYKKTCLIFTVLLGEEEEIPAKSRLSTVEEMVDDHLQKKFLTEGHPVSYDRMDLDKYGGLWSRISHLILPVTADERIEHDGC